MPPKYTLLACLFSSVASCGSTGITTGGRSPAIEDGSSPRAAAEVSEELADARFS
jgi:hypothetical protein